MYNGIQVLWIQTQYLHELRMMRDFLDHAAGTVQRVQLQITSTIRLPCSRPLTYAGVNSSGATQLLSGPFVSLLCASTIHGRIQRK